MPSLYETFPIIDNKEHQRRSSMSLLLLLSLWLSLIRWLLLQVLVPILLLGKLFVIIEANLDVLRLLVSNFILS